MKARDIAVPAAVALLAIGGVARTAPGRPAGAATTSPSRATIVSVAQRQVHHGSCSPGYYHSCGTRWCAEFARWVWAQGGVSAIAGLDGYAQSFQSYGQHHRTWHPRAGYTPVPGDAIVFDWDHLPAGGGHGHDSHPIDHVAIVVAVNGGRVSTVGGDQGSRSSLTTVSTATYSTASRDIIGYTSPAGLDPPDRLVRPAG
jgi:hypothetical protein